MHRIDMKASHYRFASQYGDKSIEEKIHDVVWTNITLIFLKGILMLVVIAVLAIYIFKKRHCKCFEVKILTTMALSYALLAFLFGNKLSSDKIS